LKISILVEGKTETALKPHLHAFLESRLEGRMPRLDMFKYDGRIPKGDKLRRVVETLLAQGSQRSDAVIALTDVYTGDGDFTDAMDAKNKMRGWVGANPAFYPHVAQHDFEAWLLPFWDEIQKLARHNRKAPPGQPESVNHTRPPSFHIQEIFRIGTCRDDYSKPRDANRILRNKDLMIAAGRPGIKGILKHHNWLEWWDVYLTADGPWRVRTKTWWCGTVRAVSRLLTHHRRACHLH
jgi:hypothetical protein